MDYKQAINYLESFIDYEKRGRKPLKNPFRLDRVRKLLEELGNPHEKFRTVHIAGTNGKGSTAAFLASILTRAGLKTGLYTSPHLVSFRERIRTDGCMITEEETAGLAAKIKTAGARVFHETGLPSFFEVYTALCFLYFSEKRVDYAVVETGLGGRLDATNVINPSLCILTPIGMDHQRELGGTLEEIAAEKCGIIKPRIPVITSAQAIEVLEVIKKTTLKTGSRLTEIRFAEESEGSSPSGELLLVKIEHSSLLENVFTLQTASGAYEKLSVRLPGRRQALNAGAAGAAAIALGIKEIHIREGLAKTSIPGRMQFIPGKPALLLDGGHNPPAAGNLAECLKALFKQYKITLIFGVSQDKDYRGVADKIFPAADRIILTRSLNPRAAPPELLAGHLAGYRDRIITAPGIREALSLAVNSSGRNSLTCVAGSFFLVGEALALLDKEPCLFQLKTRRKKLP